MIASLNNLVNPYLHHVPIIFTTHGSLIAALLLTYFSKFLQVITSVLFLGKYDNIQASHRTSTGEGKDGKKPGFGAKLVQRAWNAHQNSWEAFAAFSVSVLLALHTSGDSKNLNILVNAYILVRLVYNFVYILAFNDLFAAVRSLVWVVSFGLVLQIFAIAVGDNWVTLPAL